MSYIKTENDKNKKAKNRVIAWTVALSLLSGLVFGLSFLLYSSASTAGSYAVSLESVYQKSHYDLTDKVNNIELKLSKALSSQNSTYNEKLLNEISKNCEDAQNNLNMLPANEDGAEESLKFINQVGGYCSSLAKKLNKGQTLSAQDMQTLNKLHQAVLGMQKSLNRTSQNIGNGYSFVKDGLSMNSDESYNNVTLSLQSMKEQSVEYPTMIYDGPFSDSEIKQEIKGMANLKVESKEVALGKLEKLFDLNRDEIEDKGEAAGNFETYNFAFTHNNINFFAQYSQKGARLLTMASYNDRASQSIGKDEAVKKAKEFLNNVEIDNLEVVWSDIVGADAYFNFAPIINGIIIYPDLVKVKVDLASGVVSGFEAKSYYTNNTERTLGILGISSQEAQKQVESGFAISTTKKALAPIELQEVLCWEFKAMKSGQVYYFYVDGQTGQLVNVLRVIHTNQGSKLM
jgi:germination protein YpeB